jgi:hypothetical protein
VEQLPQPLGAFLIEDIAGSFGTASEVLSYLWDVFFSGAGQEYLGTSQGESVFGAQPGFELFALVV